MPAPIGRITSFIPNLTSVFQDMDSIMLSSSIGILSLLNEPDHQLKYFALQKLNIIVDEFWVEISEYVAKLEILQEDTSFMHRDLAALVVSKVYYNLGEYEEALNYALKAGKLFNIDDNSEFVTTMISKCLDLYIKLRQAEYFNKNPNIDPHIILLVEEMFQRCIDDKKYKQAIGIALESFRLDLIQKVLIESNNDQDILNYTFKVSLTFIQNLSFLKMILQELVNIYLSQNLPNYINICQCLIYLDDPTSLANIIMKLLKSKNKKDILTAYQISLDAYSSASQHFLLRLRKSLGLLDLEETNEDLNAKDSFHSLNKLNKDFNTKLESILSGELPIQLYLHFLIHHNHTDIQILKNTKDSVRNSICHNAVIIAHSYINCGTTNDKFLRNNLEWLAKATNWAKFTATASLGVIHKGQIKDGRTIMSTYLPKEQHSGSPYSEGGALYALGFINVSHGSEIIDYLMEQMSLSNSEIVKHGICLGLGLSSISSARQDIYDVLKIALYQDDAVLGEAAGLSMGLVLVGTKLSSALDDMLSYAKDTRHEKIIRGLIVGISLICFGTMEQSEILIQSLINDKDALLRRCAVYVIAMAYCGTANNNAIQRLLNLAVSDVNDDVRRSAVTCIGFLLIQNPEQCPNIVALLSESYNPHVRYGAALALGISCAGTNLKESLNMIEPLIDDNVNFVRQGALIASAMILIQQNEVTQPKVHLLREKYAKLISDKHEEIMVKFGAILAQGIIDAGGRNTTISYKSNKGHLDAISIVGTLVFTQYWFWYPFSLFLSLSFKPSILVTLNQELKMPKMEFISNAKPLTYAYPSNLEIPKGKEKTKIKSVVLSYTAHKSKIQPAPKSTHPEDEVMDIEKSKNPVPVVDKVAEPNFSIVENPARIMIDQLKCMNIVDNDAYVSVKSLQEGGIIMIDDKKGDSSISEIIPLCVQTFKTKTEDEEEEPTPPEPFKYIDE